MPLMQPPSESERVAPGNVDPAPHSQLPKQDLPPPLEDDRSADILETQSIKWNVARIVRLSSGRFALLTHYRAGALDIIKVGTIEEIVDHIPSAEQCIPDYEPRLAGAKENQRLKTKANLDNLLADIGLT